VLKKSTYFLGLANAFSGGLFMGIALFHLLPEASDEFTTSFMGVESVWARLPLHYIIAFCSYSLILFIEKVAFDSHSLIDDHHHGEEDSNMEPLLSKEEKQDVNEEILDYIDGSPDKDLVLVINDEDNGGEEKTVDPNNKQDVVVLPVEVNPMLPAADEKRGSTRVTTQASNYAHGDNEDNNSDIDEETLKMIVSSKGKFGAYLSNRNIRKVFMLS
jgi:hypothetical protein